MLVPIIIEVSSEYHCKKDWKNGKFDKNIKYKDWDK